MTDLAVVPHAAGANSAPPAKAPTTARPTKWLRKFMPRLGIVPRLTLIGVLSIFAAVAVSVWISVTITEAEMYRRAQTNLAINIKLLDSVLADLGAPSRKGDRLYFGSTLINGNFEPVDRVKAVAGGTATVFLNDQRVTTNVMKPDGSRAVGTKLAPGPAYDSVFTQHQTYRGEANILGETYLTIYEPIIGGGEVIGIAYVGVKKAEFFDVLQRLLTSNIELGLLAVLVGGLIMFILVRRVFAPIGGIKRELVTMAKTTTQQELDARTLAILDDDLDELRETLYRRGEPRRDGDFFLFGDKPVNNDLDLADSVGGQHGTLVSIFMGDQRVTTNVRNAEGERILGTELAPGPVHDRVLKQAKTFRGDATIFGKLYFSIYEPVLFNGEVIGILYVGTPHVVSDETAAQLVSQSGGEIEQMREALAKLKKAGAAKEDAERQAAEQRQEARDAQRRLQASQRDTERHMQGERARNAAAQTGVVNALAYGLTKLSEGDLTIRLSEGFTVSTRQIRDHFNAAVARLQETIGAIVTATREVSGASHEISSSTTDLSQRTEEQAASLEQTSAAMEQISSTARRNAQNAQHASRSASGACELAERSGQVVASTVEAMAQDQGLVRQDRRHYRLDRRDRAADQPARAQCCGGSGARRRRGTRLCRGGVGSPQLGAAVVAGRQGHRAADHCQQQPGSRRRRSGRPIRRLARRHRPVDQGCRRDRGRDRIREHRAVERHRADQQGARSDGPDHAAEFGAGGAERSDRKNAGVAGRGDERTGRHFPDWCR